MGKKISQLKKLEELTGKEQIPVALNGDNFSINSEDLKGEKGDIGPKGEQGIQGIQGVKGERGEPGEPGEQGIRGERGPAGPEGPRGEKGEKGDRGPKGDKGDTGKSFSIKKIYPSIKEMEEDKENPIFEDGDIVIINSHVEDPDNAKAFMHNKDSWKFLTDLSGAQGIQGPKGDKGDQGPKGDQGERGPEGKIGPEGPRGDTGPRGPSGKDGKDGESIDEVDITFIPWDAFVEGSLEIPEGGSGTIVGRLKDRTYANKLESASGKLVSLGNILVQSILIFVDDYGDRNLLFNVSGDIILEAPQGKQGPQGETGPEGPQGKIGPKGDKGEKGNDGLPGPKGDRGPQGEQGPRGPRGYDGKQGKPGKGLDKDSFTDLDKYSDKITRESIEDDIIDISIRTSDNEPAGFRISEGDLIHYKGNLATVYSSEFENEDGYNYNFIEAEVLLSKGAGSLLLNYKDMGMSSPIFFNIFMYRASLSYFTEKKEDNPENILGKVAIYEGVVFIVEELEYLDEDISGLYIYEISGEILSKPPKANIESISVNEEEIEPNKRGNVNLNIPTKLSELENDLQPKDAPINTSSSEERAKFFREKDTPIGQGRLLFESLIERAHEEGNNLYDGVGLEYVIKDSEDGWKDIDFSGPLFLTVPEGESPEKVRELIYKDLNATFDRMEELVKTEKGFYLRSYRFSEIEVSDYSISNVIVNRQSPTRFLIDISVRNKPMFRAKVVAPKLESHKIAISFMHSDLVEGEKGSVFYHKPIGGHHLEGSILFSKGEVKYKDKEILGISLENLPESLDEEYFLDFTLLESKYHLFDKNGEEKPRIFFGFARVARTSGQIYTVNKGNTLFEHELTIGDEEWERAKVGDSIRIYKELPNQVSKYSSYIREGILVPFMRVENMESVKNLEMGIEKVLISS